jgi:hypothetical protein
MVATVGDPRDATDDGVYLAYYTPEYPRSSGSRSVTAQSTSAATVTDPRAATSGVS